MGFGGDGSHQNDAAEPDFKTAGFDENKWFEEKAERLRLQNEQQCLELEKMRLAAMQPHAKNRSLQQAAPEAPVAPRSPVPVFVDSAQPSLYSTVDSFFSGEKG